MNPIKQFIEESGTSVVAKFSREDDGLLDLSKYDGDILEKEVISQQLALVEKIYKDEIEYWKNIFDNPPKREKEYPCDNCTKNIARIEIERYEKLLQDLTIKK